MSSFVLKLIAVISMVFDHSGYVIFNGFSAFNFLGRLAFPIFAFQLTQGYTHTKSLKKYFLRLILFALISQIPFMLFRIKFVEDIFVFNIFFTLSLGLANIWIYDKNKILGMISLISFSVVAQLINFDYGAFGIIIIFIFYAFKNNKILMNFFFIFAVILKYLFYLLIYYNTIYFSIYLALCTFTILSIILIDFYNGKEGKKVKYLLYIFYPLHLLILYFL